MSKVVFQRTMVLTILACIILGILISIWRPEEDHPDENSGNFVPFCTILPSSVDFVLTHDTIPFVGSPALYWPARQKLRISFYDGPLQVQRRVLLVAKTWATLAHMEFIPVSEYDTAEVRISFQCAGYNSLVGTQNLDKKYTGRPTMCLEGLDTLQDNAAFTRTVLHEFGHVMGLLHELQSPVAKIPWDTAKLYAYYKDTYNWDRDSVNKWVLKLYDNVEHSDFDEKSIMLYAVPKAVTKGDFFIPWPNELSKDDIDFIRKNYK